MATPKSVSRAVSRWLLVPALLVCVTACAYHERLPDGGRNPINHWNYGATDKLVDSDVNTFAKIPGAFIVSLVDGIVSPITMAVDRLGKDQQYSPDHEYFTYSGSRVIARSDMGAGYQWLTSIPSLVTETLWFPVTGLIDLVTILATDAEDQPNAAND